jgi:AraC-like DNA-binding protein
VLFLSIAPISTANEAVQSDSCAEISNDQFIINMLADQPAGQLRPLSVAHFADPSGLITADQITAQSFVEHPCTGRFAIQGPHGALWFRFSIENPHDRHMDWVVAFMESVFDDMALYQQIDAGLVLRAQNGRMVSLAERSDVSVKTALPITLTPGETADVYIRISGVFAKFVTPVIVSANMFDRWMTSFGAVLLIILGPMALLAVASLILFRNVIAQFYKYYTLYMLSSFLFIFVVYGWIHRVFDIQFPVTWTVPLIELTIGVCIIANIQYCRVMLSGGRSRRRERLGYVVLTGIAIFFCCIAMLNPWRFAMPNHLMQFISPIVLLVLFSRHLRRLPQAVAVCASLVCLICGLAVSNYYFLSPPQVPVTSSVWEVMFTRFGTFSYGAAIIGEALFMMLAISTMLNRMRFRSQIAFEQVKELRHSLVETESASAQAIEVAQARIKLMQDSLGGDAHEHLSPVEDRFEDQARTIIIDNLGTEEFGSRALAKAMGMSERTLGRRTNEMLGITPAALIRQTRLNLARDLLLLRQYSTVAEVAFATSFSSVSHFAKLYRAEFNTTPSDTLRSSRLKATAA